MRHAFLSFVLFAGLPVWVHAEDLVTRDGTVYHDYKVLSHDAGFLTIMYSDGGGKIPLSNLPDALQKQYGYDKQAADAAVQAAVAQDRQDRLAIANEQAQHQQQIAAHAVASSDAPAGAMTSDQAAAMAAANAPAPVPASAMPAAPPASTPTPAVAPAPAPVAAATPSNVTAQSNDLVPPSDAAEFTPLEEQIVECEVDLHSMKVELEHEARQMKGDDYTHGAFDAKVTQAEDQLKFLKKQEKDVRRAEVRKGKPKLTPDQVAAIRQEILQLQTAISKAQMDVYAESKVQKDDGNSHGAAYASMIRNQMKIDRLSAEINY